MNILLLGSGGREHAIAWKLSQSKNLTKLFIAPGNPGTAKLGTNININPLDFESVRNCVLDFNIDMVVVGPEEPLVKGIFDAFKTDERVKDVRFIGPSRKGAMLEGSKDFAKSFMIQHGIPTAKYKSFKVGEFDIAKKFIETLTPPYVIKADGLAAGKGVVISSDLNEAYLTLEDFFNGKFGEASKTVVIEEFLNGIELSVFVLTDGISYLVLPEAKDYKRVGDGDTGPNTGGMGAVSPVPFATDDFMRKVEERIIKPTILGLQKENIIYHGFIFLGLMNVNGDPYVIEYNTRLGDPETEVVLPRIENDLIDILTHTADGTLNECTINTSQKTVTTVILVSKGYPGDYEKGKTLSGIDNLSDVVVFHAGTKYVESEIQTAGGRVIALTGIGNSIEDALTKSYQAATLVNFDGKFYRKDIGKDLMK